MNFFVISNIGSWADRKLLGLTPTARALFQVRAAGAEKATLLVSPGTMFEPPAGAPDKVALEYMTVDGIPLDMESFATSLSERVHGPVCVMDANAIFQRDFAQDAAGRTSNTVFSACGREIAAVRTGDGDFSGENIDGRATDIDTPERVKTAKRMLLDGLRKPLLVDGLVGYYIQRPITLRITSLIVNTPILPNHVTAFCMVLGLTGAALVFLANSREWMMQLGMLLYFAGSVFDCVDGEMSRLKYKGSYLGAWLDTISDDTSTAAILIAMGFYVAQMTGQLNWLMFGAGAALVFLLGEAYVYYHLLTVYHSGDVLDFQWASGVKKRASAESIVDYLMLLVKRDFFSFALFVMGLIGVIHWGLVWLAAMMYLYGGYVLVDVILSLKNRGWRTRTPH
jgi:phosphatidylglycerophosphate synthase